MSLKHTVWNHIKPFVVVVVALKLVALVFMAFA